MPKTGLTIVDIMYSDLKTALNDNYLNCPGAVFFVGGIVITCRFFQNEIIENDINPQQIDSYFAHFQLMAYMTGLSEVLGKEVVLTAENNTPGNLFSSLGLVSMASCR